ncbi:MAG: hypothetical protein H6750_08585 [Nitrospiraceae bacterium]|nr:hypothetical protein [Nitrospiraceae bacterium]
MSLAQSINQAKAFGVWLHEKTNERMFPDGIRERTGHALLQHSEDIANAIIVLLDAQFPGPALSLARPLFEAYVRGFWISKYASDDQVFKFNNGKCPKFRDLLAEIPKDAESGGAWIHATVEKNLKAFHDLTHGGSEHVLRRNRVGSVEPSYPEQELVQLIEFGNEIRVRIGNDLLSRLNDLEAMEKLHEWAQVFRTEL